MIDKAALRKLAEDRADMRKRAEAWLSDHVSGRRITRGNAINEENLALDVVDLLDALEATEAELEEVTSSPSPRGQEAEELRGGIEALLKDEPGGDIESNHEWRAALLKLLDAVDARDSLSHLVARDEISKLRTRRDELLATIARISQSTPLDSEVAEALEQRGKLLAEIGTLRAERQRQTEMLEGMHRLVAKQDVELEAFRTTRPIIEAANAWRASMGALGNHTTDDALIAAIDTAADHATTPRIDEASVPVSFTSGPYAACTCTPTAHGHRTDCPRYRA